MSLMCAITLRKKVTGNKVSHAQNKSKRNFNINIHKVSLYSNILCKYIKLKVSKKGHRTVMKKAGIDGYLLNTKNRFLLPLLKNFKKQIQKKIC